MARRKSINYPGYSHQNPIPNASRIGNILMSSIMNGTEPGTRTAPPDLAGQVTNIFKHIRLCVEAAGGTVDDIIKINFWMKQPSTGRAALNEEWVKMRPTPMDFVTALSLSADSAHHVTCDFMAVIG